ncbi:MAG: GGDEF domain-containing protein [Robiginitomaculum sp.]|nr:MAG: GGDEF domain-containing protein [Robiginitomaculum sp.]
MSAAPKQNNKNDQAHAKMVLKLLADHNLETTPDNYQLFHGYVADKKPALVKEMRPLLTSGPLNQSACTSLHRRYFGGTDLVDQALQTGGKFSEEIGTVLRMLSAAEKNAVEYEKTLSGATDILENASSNKSLKEMVDTLLTATTKMHEHTHQLEQKLNKTTAEVDSLRDNLELVRTEAMTDALTGIANRKRFDEFILQQCNTAEANGQALSLVLCDIDHFKRFNDTWGHQTGDQIIRFVASCLQRHAAKSHLVARYGGEEFAVIMPLTDGQAAFDMADNIRASVESKKLLRKSTNEDMGTVTISLGVAQFTPDDAIEDLIERADEALYRSKHAGRNKVSISTDPQDGRSAA